MKTYRVALTEDALRDLEELRDYIQYHLRNPIAARSYVHALRQDLKRLMLFPERHPFYEEEPWRSRGVRFVPIKNHVAYYIMDESAKQVVVIALIYSRRDQRAAMGGR